MYINLNSFVVLVIPIAERKYIIATYMRSEDADFGAQGLEAAYEAALQSVPAMAARLKKATRVTNVVGVRKIANGYREASGAGWALVGDALHFKDPLDGQGIYDALLETKILTEAIVSWKRGGKTWAEAAAWYQEQVMAATHPMFVQTMLRVKQQMFTPLPEMIVKTYMRWMLTDPHYQASFLRYVSRAIDPADFSVKASISPGIIFRGIARDLRQRFAS
jgi:flavin-dependent dehydrogenase